MRLLVIFFALFISTTALSQPECDNIFENLVFKLTVVDQDNMVPPELEQGDDFFIEVDVCGFTDILTFSFTLSYDPNVLEYDSFNQLGSPLIGDVGINDLVTDTGNIGFLWTNLNAEGQTLPSPSEIFKLFFEVVGEPGDEAIFSATNNISAAEINVQLPDGTICVSNDVNIEIIYPVNIVCTNLYASITNCAADANDGEINFDICGGTAPYTWELEGNLTGPVDSGNADDNTGTITLNNLAPDDYVLVVTDAAGGFFDQFITIGQGTPITVSADVTSPPLCNGFDGTITATADGGDGNYSWEWSNGFFGAPELDRVPEGTYTVTVTDGGGCSATAMVSMMTPPLLVSVGTVDATCNGSADGEVTIVASGGTPFGIAEYSYEGMTSDVFFLNNLDPGEYPFTVSDQSGCTIDASFSIGSTFVPDITVDTMERIKCFNDLGFFRIINANPLGSSGFVFVTNQDGENIISSSKAPCGWIDVPAPNQDGVPPGTYTIEFTTEDNCTVEYEMVIPTPPEIFVELVDQVDPTCDGDPGSIDVDVMGGNGDFSFEWSNGDTNQNLTDLGPDTYILTVTDGEGCTDTLAVDLIGTGSIALNITQDAGVGCGSSSDAGALTVDIQTTATNIEIEWTNTSGDVIGTEESITGLGAGTYTVNVTDLDGDCSNTAEATISGAGSFTFEPIVNQPICNGDNSGSIQLDNLMGGDPPFTFSWSHDENLDLSLAQNLEADEYTVTITDSAGCEQDTIFNLENPEDLMLELGDVIDVSCFGATDGQAFAFASGSPVGAIEFSYFWSSGSIDDDFAQEGDAENLEPGQQWVYAFDGFCTSDTLFFEVGEPIGIELDSMASVIAGPTCIGESDGMIDIVAVGGTVAGDYEYDWSDGEEGSSRANLAGGNYELTITDDRDCEQVFQFNLQEPDSLVLEIDPFLTVGVNCAGDNSAIIGVAASGGIGEYTYTWDPEVSDENIAFDLGVGQYVITVTDGAGCTASTNFKIEGSSAVEADVLPVIEPDCSGGSTMLCLDQPSGGNGFGYVYSVNLGPNIPIDSCLEVSAGPYSISVFDSEGCGMLNPIELTVEQPDPIGVVLNSDPIDQVLELGDSTGMISAIITSTNPIVDIQWSSTVGSFDCANTSCSDINIFTSNPSFYAVTVTDANDCTAIAELFIDVKTTRNVFLPNIFTPDDDGFNDFFTPFIGSGIEIVNYFHVYDRWGNLMHRAENIAPGSELDDDIRWDGNYNGLEAQPGVYVFIAEVEFVDGEVIVFKGDVSLVR